MGEEEQVWREIMSSKSSNQEIVSLIIDEMINRFCYNLEVITTELKKHGYVFTGFDYGQPLPCAYALPFLEAQEDSKQKKKELTKSFKDYGVFPIVFVKLMQALHNIDFLGYFPEWSKPSILLDQLLLFPIELIIPLNSNDIHKDKDGRYTVIFSFDEFTKEKISGGVGYGIYLSENTEIDSLVSFFGKEPITFVEYLRLCIKWAGFPGLEWAESGDIPDKILTIIEDIRSKCKAI